MRDGEYSTVIQRLQLLSLRHEDALNNLCRGHSFLLLHGTALWLLFYADNATTFNKKKLDGELLESPLRIIILMTALGFCTLENLKKIGAIKETNGEICG